MHATASPQEVMDIHFIIHRSCFPKDYKNMLYGSESLILIEVEKKKKIRVKWRRISWRKGSKKRKDKDS